MGINHHNALTMGELHRDLGLRRAIINRRLNNILLSSMISMRKMGMGRMGITMDMRKIIMQGTM